MEQRTQEWFDARLSKVTASRVADVIAKTRTGVSTSRQNYLTQIVTERLTGKKADSGYINQAMQDGIDREEAARSLYELKYGIVKEVGFIDHPTIAMSGASPDGIIADGDGVLEIKCPIETTHTNTLMTDKVPSKYIPQIQWQMAVTGARFAHFVSYNPNFPDNMVLFVKQVDRDDEYIKMLVDEIITFLKEVDNTIIKLKELKDGISK
jgi:putative phage-type endonuclease